MRYVVYHPKAPSEARQLFEYYQKISSNLAEEFWNELLEVVEIAREFPTRHHFDSTGLRRSNLKRFPVHILFKPFLRIFESQPFAMISKTLIMERIASNKLFSYLSTFSP